MKRSVAIISALALTLACCLGVAAASGGIAPRESLTISSTSAVSRTGDNTGEVDFEFSIVPTKSADRLGAASILIYKPDGTTERVIGNTKNGLIGSGNAHTYTYTYKGVSGQSYYADIMLFSTIGSVSDSRTRTTKSAVAR